MIWIIRRHSCHDFTGLAKSRFEFSMNAGDKLAGLVRDERFHYLVEQGRNFNYREVVCIVSRMIVAAVRIWSTIF